MQWEGDQLYSRAETSGLWVFEMCFHFAFSSCGGQSLCLAGIFSVENIIVALVLLFCCSLPLEVYIFINLWHSVVDKSVVKYLKAIFLDINFSI